MVAITSPVTDYTSTAVVWYVPSDSTPGLTYSVTSRPGICPCGQKVEGIYHCSCPDHIHRARDCKHVKRALHGQAPAVVVPAPAPVRLRAITPADVDELYG